MVVYQSQTRKSNPIFPSISRPSIPPPIYHERTTTPVQPGDIDVLPIKKDSKHAIE